MSNIVLKMSVEDYLEQLKSISTALDNAQSRNHTIGEDMHIFKDLKKKSFNQK